MKDYLTIGSSPVEEECAQVGSPDYYNKVMPECKRYIDLIRQKMGPEPAGAKLVIKSFPHDFGTYHEVCCVFEDSLPEAIAYAFACENNGPLTWDDTDPYDWKQDINENPPEELF